MKNSIKKIVVITALIGASTIAFAATPPTCPASISWSTLDGGTACQLPVNGIMSVNNLPFTTTSTAPGYIGANFSFAFPVGDNGRVAFSTPRTSSCIVSGVSALGFAPTSSSPTTPFYFCPATSSTCSFILFSSAVIPTTCAFQIQNTSSQYPISITMLPSFDSALLKH